MESSCFYGSSSYRWWSSLSPIGGSWQSYAVRQRSLQILQSFHFLKNKNRFLEQVEEPRMGITKTKRWEWSQEIIARPTNRRLCLRRRSTSWERWSISAYASPSAGCQCTASWWSDDYRYKLKQVRSFSLEKKSRKMKGNNFHLQLGSMITWFCILTKGNNNIILQRFSQSIIQSFFVSKTHQTSTVHITMLWRIERLIIHH